MLELERTFVVKKLPQGLEQCKSVEIIDRYIPKTREHPILRIRKIGDKLEMTKKCPTPENDVSKQEEQTIPLSEEEYKELSNIDGKRLHKIRFCYPYKGMTAEVDIYKGELEGLVTVDFEFESEKEKDRFEMPEFCLADVTYKTFVAGGMLCGKRYEDIKSELDAIGYEKVII